MTPSEPFWPELGALGVRLSVDDGRFKVNAPKGKLTDKLKAVSHRIATVSSTRLREDGPHGADDLKLRHVATNAAASPNGRPKALLVPGQDRSGSKRSECHVFRCDLMGRSISMPSWRQL